MGEAEHGSDFCSYAKPPLNKVRGEICGLRWDDVDIDKGMLYIRHSLGWENSSLTLRPVKTSYSERAVKLPPIAITALKKEKRRQTEDKLRAGILYQNLNFIWTWDDGRPHSPDYLYKKYQKIISLHNLPRIRLHDLRHSHATALLLAGVHTKIVSERLGHSSTRITEEIYSHVLPEMQEQAANAIEALLQRQPR